MDSGRVCTQHGKKLPCRILAIIILKQSQRSVKAMHTHNTLLKRTTKQPFMRQKPREQLTLSTNKTNALDLVPLGTPHQRTPPGSNPVGPACVFHAMPPPGSAPVIPTQAKKENKQNRQEKKGKQEKQGEQEKIDRQDKQGKQAKTDRQEKKGRQAKDEGPGGERLRRGCFGSWASRCVRKGRHGIRRPDPKASSTRRFRSER